MGPSYTQVGHELAQVGFKLSLRRVKTTQSWPQLGPSWPKSPQRQDGEKKERIDCLKKYLIESISKNFDSTNFSLQSNIVDTIILTLIVDKQGAIKLYEFEKINDSYFDTDFRNKISDIINNMSSIIPANKTNLGLSVTSKFKLPIIINTKG